MKKGSLGPRLNACSSLSLWRQVVSPFLVEEFLFRGKDGSVSPEETGLGQLSRLDVINLGECPRLQI